MPLELGTLQVKGITVRLFGGAVEEFIVPLQGMLEDSKRRTKDGGRRRQDERHRFGKTLEFAGKKGEGGGEKQERWVL